MSKLDGVMNVEGVVGAARWISADVTGGSKPPDLVECVGEIQGDDAIAAVVFLESDGITAQAQAYLWDKLGDSSITMSPVQGVAIIGDTHTFCATNNRVGAFVENSAGVDMYALAEKMMAV